MTDVSTIHHDAAKFDAPELQAKALSKGWSGLIRMLLFFNIIGLVGLWINAVQATEMTSELLLAPIKIFKSSEQTSRSGAVPVPVKAPILSTKIKTTITGHIVQTTVVQTFRNPTTSWMEGIYYYPLPDDAAVDRMILKIGERIIRSEIQEKRQAEATYIKAASEGKISALLTQYRPNMFSTRIANIEPGGQVSTEISFQGLAGQNGTEFTWRMPQAITPRFSPGPTEVTADIGIQTVSLQSAENERLPSAENYDQAGGKNPSGFDIQISHAADLATFSSPSHRIISQKTEGGTVRIELASGTVPADRDFILRWQFLQAKTPTIHLFQEHLQDGVYSLGLVLPPTLEDDFPDIPRDVTFIMDVSGSMHGIAIEQGKAALISALDQLGEKDRFDIIAFNDTYRRLFGQSQMATRRNIDFAKGFVDSLEADKGTRMYPALDSALEDRIPKGYIRQILFLTDGAVSNETEMFELVHRKLDSARLFTVGLGSAPNGWFMRKAAEFGRGIHIEISDLRQAETELVSLFQEMARPTLESINVKFGASADIYPKVIPDLFGQRPLIFLVRHTEETSVPTVAALTPLGARIDIPLNKDDQRNSKGVAKLWASRKVEGLSDALARGMDEEIVKTAILDVALKHQIMSPYTSFVAVDKTPVRIQNDFLKKMKVKGNLPIGASWSKIHGPQTATPMELYAWMGAIPLFLAITIVWFRRGRRDVL